MEQRYSRLYTQAGMLYAEASPVIIEAGTVLADSLTKKVLVQLKFRNISDREITSLLACILPLDASGEAQDKAVEYLYNNLSIPRDESFGAGAAVVMPNTEVRSYKVRVGKVCFADGSEWQGQEDYFAPLPAPERLENAFDDEEMSRQFRISYGEDCIYLASEAKDLWFCTCGAVNHADESKCHKCRRVHSALKNINVDSLRSETTKRLSSEMQQEAEEDIENTEKRSKLLKLLAIIVPVVLILVILLATLPGYFARKNNYAKAAALLEQGEYDQAQQLYEELGDYEDSRELAEKEIPYRRAVYIMDCAAKGDTDGLVMLGLKRSELGEGETVSTALYRKASEMFAALGDYKDCAAQSAAADKAVSAYFEGLISDSYDAAVKLLKEKSFCQARDAFLGLGEYKDSREMVSECIYRKAEMLSELNEKYSMDGIFCSLSTVTGEKSVFYIPQEVYIQLGSGISTDIRDICGPDGVEINYEEPPEDYLSFREAVSSLYASLGQFKDSADKSGFEADEVDQSESFYALISEGKLSEALTWLNDFGGEFADRDQWASFIGLYLPFCGSWEFDSGDPSLFPRTVGADVQCAAITTAVFLSEDGGAVLRVCMDGNDDYPIELQPTLQENGSISFFVSPDGVTTFYLVINNSGMLNYSQYNNNYPTGQPQSAVYSKAE